VIIPFKYAYIPSKGFVYVPSVSYWLYIYQGSVWIYDFKKCDSKMVI
jgi:hypothetical protein